MAMAELSNLGRYQLRRVLGKGAMGVVYDAYDPTINRRVAIKVILKSQAIDEAMARDYSARFVREAQAAGRISHPNIVQVYDFGEQEDIAYLVLEFIEGRDLRSFFTAKEPFEIQESVRIMGELLDALDFAHQAGVIHRDVKPANVMLDAQRRVKLADFGVARIQDAERTGADTMVGTPAFMSPEQISGLKIDHRTDIFSAGSILYQLLTGEQPFKGEGAWTVAKKIMQDEPPLPSRVTLSVAPAFDAIVSKALAKDPAQRYASAREFAVALRATYDDRTRIQPPAAAPKPKAKPESHGSEIEIEFWRSIQSSNDPDELELYLEQFPEGPYAKLARHKIAKLRGIALPKDAEDSGTLSRQAEEARVRKEAEEQATLVDTEIAREAEENARREAEARSAREAEERRRKDAEEQARRVAEEQARRAAEGEAKRQAEETLRREEEARREAEARERAKREAAEKAQRDAEEAARKEAAEKARREAEQKARREAEERAKREAEERAHREAEEQARRDAEAKSRAEAEARVRAEREAAAKAQRDAEEAAARARREAEQKLRREAEEKAAREREEKNRQALDLELAKLKQQAPAAGVEAAFDEDATVGTAKPLPLSPESPVKGKTSNALPAITAVVLIAGGLAAYLMFGRTPTPPKVEVAAVDRAAEERIRKEAEERVRSEFAGKLASAQAALDQAAAEKAAMEKKATDKAAAEKVIADKAAVAKAAAEKLAADKAAAEKAAAESAALAKAALEQAAAARAAAEKMAADKAAADEAAARKEAAAKAAADKLAADKSAAERAAAEKAALAKSATAAAPSMQRSGTQSWEYLVYPARGGTLRGHITLEEKAGKAILNIATWGYIDICYKGDLDATVIRTEATTTITAGRDLRGCEPFRFVIRNDGSGGETQVRRGSNWVSDRINHGFTPRK